MSKRLLVSIGRTAILAGTVALCLAAPASWAQKSSEKAAEDRLAFRKSVVAIHGQIDTTVGALKGIVDAKDDSGRKSAFKKYGDQIKEMDKQIQKTRDYAKQMKERGQAYFVEWEKSMQSITNEALKARAAERRAALQNQYQTIEANIEKARQDSAKFWKDLQELQKYFENDSSADAVAGSKDLVDSAGVEGKKIQGYIDEVIAAVDQVGKQVAPQPTAEAQPEGQAPPESGMMPEAGTAPEGEVAPEGAPESGGR